MTILAPINLPNGDAVNYNNGEIEYFTLTDPYQFEIDNRPLKNLAHRDNLVADHSNAIVNYLNISRGALDTLGERLDVSLNSDGTLKNFADLGGRTATADLLSLQTQFNSSQSKGMAKDNRRERTSGTLFVGDFTESLTPGQGEIGFNVANNVNSILFGTNIHDIFGYHVERNSEEITLSSPPAAGGRIDVIYLEIHQQISHEIKVDSNTGVTVDSTLLINDSNAAFLTNNVLKGDYLLLVGNQLRKVDTVLSETQLRVEDNIAGTSNSASYQILSKNPLFFEKGIFGNVNTTTDASASLVVNTVGVTALGLFYQTLSRLLTFSNVLSGNLDDVLQQVSPVGRSASPDLLTTFSKNSAGVYSAISSSSSLTSEVYASPVLVLGRRNTGIFGLINQNGGTARPDGLLATSISMFDCADLRNPVQLPSTDTNSLLALSIGKLSHGNLKTSLTQAVKNPADSSLTAFPMYGTELITTEVLAHQVQPASNEVIYETTGNNGFGKHTDNIRSVWSDGEASQYVEFVMTPDSSYRSNTDWLSSANNSGSLETITISVPINASNHPIIDGLEYPRVYLPNGVEADGYWTDLNAPWADLSTPPTAAVFHVIGNIAFNNAIQLTISVKLKYPLGGGMKFIPKKVHNVTVEGAVVEFSEVFPNGSYLQTMNQSTDNNVGKRVVYFDKPTRSIRVGEVVKALAQTNLLAGNSGSVVFKAQDTRQIISRYSQASGDIGLEPVFGQTGLHITNSVANQSQAFQVDYSGESIIGVFEGSQATNIVQQQAFIQVVVDYPVPETSEISVIYTREAQHEVKNWEGTIISDLFMFMTVSGTGKVKEVDALSFVSGKVDIRYLEDSPMFGKAIAQATQDTIYNLIPTKENVFVGYLNETALRNHIAGNIVILNNDSFADKNSPNDLGERFNAQISYTKDLQALAYNPDDVKSRINSVSFMLGLKGSEYYLLVISKEVPLLSKEFSIGKTDPSDKTVTRAYKLNMQHKEIV